MTDTVREQMFAASVALAEQAARAQRRRENPYRCTSCSYATHAASSDPDGYCPWCRAEATEAAKAKHLGAALGRLIGPLYAADDTDGLLLEDRSGWSR